ncbi:glycosyltransferase [Spirosoma oryzicola]|uniref:glycosyltransferase n=1 Tax=Spirosoma oryzicola TaxID=2898794 RepID=UPI001E4AC923|nr:glycosyltransferase [Spirosoma oryzicola]UHG92567.1 glycosyltransferase [Spirosoma oryzicola]
MMSADWFYPSQMGGPSNAIYWQAKAMTQAGHQVTVVATSQDIPSTVPTSRWLTLACGRVMYTKNPHFYLPFAHIWYAVVAIRQVEVVHINSLFYPSSVVLVIAARLLRKRIIWAPHGELSPRALIYRSRLKQGLLRLFRVVSKDVIFHSTCPAETVHIRQHFGHNALVQELENMMEMAPARTRKPEPYLLFIGRLHPIKAIDRLLEALSESAIFRSGAYSLTIAGPDTNNYQSHLEELVTTWALTEKVTFVGPVHGEHKEQLLANAYVTILPSHSENFGNVVIESLAQGTPVIASTGTPWQLLETKRAGCWVDNNPSDLCHAIEQFLRLSVDAYASYRQGASELARRFDIHANVAQWERFYEDALG